MFKWITHKFQEWKDFIAEVQLATKESKVQEMSYGASYGATPFVLPKIEPQAAQAELSGGGPAFLNAVEPIAQRPSGILLLNPLGINVALGGQEKAEAALRKLQPEGRFSQNRIPAGLVVLGKAPNPEDLSQRLVVLSREPEVRFAKVVFANPPTRAEMVTSSGVLLPSAVTTPGNGKDVILVIR